MLFVGRLLAQLNALFLEVVIMMSKFGDGNKLKDNGNWNILFKSIMTGYVM